MSSKPTLYALLVGINAYPRKPLAGCIHDVALVKQYLLTQTEAFHVNENTIKTLTDHQASKASVVESFKNHFKNATEQDTVLFYFSGHGCQETADTAIWPQERDGKLECIVCYPIPGSQASFLLADKEIRYLMANLYSANQPEIITIFDCCHSGDNTRESWVMQGFEASGYQNYRAVRRLQAIAPQRPWSEFIFHNTITPKEAANGFPAAPHIQIAACQDQQLAIENNDLDPKQVHGVFTHTLVRILRETNGNVSYYDLKTRTKNFLKFKYDQIPQLYYHSQDPNHQFRGFLGKTIDQRIPFQGLLSKNAHNNWMLNLGVLNGISPALTHLDLAIQGIGETKASIQKRAPDITIVGFEAAFAQKLADADQFSFTCFVHNFLSEPITLYIMDNEGVENLQKLVDNITQEVRNIEIVEQELNANYILQIIDGEYRLFYGHDQYQLRPITQVIERYQYIEAGNGSTTEDVILENKRADQTLLGYLKQMAQWTYIKELENQHLDDNPFQQQWPLKIHFYKAEEDDHYQRIEAENNVFTVDFYKEEDQKNVGAFRLEVKNVYQHPVYFAMAVLDTDFTAQTKLDDDAEDVYLIQPGEKIMVIKNAEVIEMPYITDYNWPATTSYLKFIVSTDDNIDVGLLNIDKEIPTPETVETNRTYNAFREEKVIREENLRHINTPAKKQKNRSKGWTTQIYTLYSPNPVYNQITPARLQTLINHEVVGEYAIRLYLEKNGLNIIDEETQRSSRSGNTPTKELYALKEDINQENTGIKDFIWDAKLYVVNRVAKYFRRRRFKRQLKRYPDRLLMISEGDSWFQHPLVEEIIDQLMKYYNIYSLGEAGDEIRNYFMKGKFYKALDDVQKKYNRTPRILLLSGGGNDILGEQLLDFVRPKDQVKEKMKPSDYFTDRFKHQLEIIMEVYADIFATTKSKIPGIDIITHGYDYILPIEKKKSWVNQYLLQQGYTTEEERKKLITYLIDTFNQRLEALTKQYVYVHYINGRTAVQPYQWYDEIHPNKKGFQQIVLKFRQKIREIT